MELVKQRDVMVHAMLKEAVPVAVEEGRLVLAFRYGFHCERVAERENTTRVVEAVRGVTGSTVNLVCRVAPEVAAAAAAPRPEDHPAVRTVLESVGGEITSIRVKGAEDGG
jgi:hypothetical protein